MKIVAGSAKGRKLRGPKTKTIRPAAARVRESVFQILGDLSGKRVLDLFAGTGSMGLEALSRGAEEVVFVDSQQAAVGLLFHNLQATGFLGKAHILKKSARSALEFLAKRKRRYDLIFLDPPYDKGFVDSTLEILHRCPLLAPNGLLVCEHSPREAPTFLSGLEIADERKYGQTLLSFLKWKSHAE
ncbi:MAG TPA: 16S rRNA (guanine(966)-N(2))-methyltransferase RsmD [Deltaproteobacteria bacterium]|nr:16S rRNA (guanine(966)-N(2))-methyltransferase RsmD [Deltaproteobacteria bacterium]